MRPRAALSTSSASTVTAASWSSSSKRGTLTRDAVAQVIDYVSFLHELDAEALSTHVETNSGRNGIQRIDDFRAWYQENFPGKSEEYSLVPRAVLVGLGVDERARRMVEFLAATGMDVTLATFQAFRRGDEVFLARQVDVAPTQKRTGTGRSYTKQEKPAAFDGSCAQAGLRGLARRSEEPDAERLAGLCVAERDPA